MTALATVVDEARERAVRLESLSRSPEAGESRYADRVEAVRWQSG